MNRRRAQTSRPLYWRIPPQRASSRRDAPIVAECAGAHLFTSPARRLTSHNAGGEWDQLVVMLSGSYAASYRIEAGGRPTQIDVRAGDVVFWPASAARIETNNPDDPMRALVVYFRGEHHLGRQPAIAHDRERFIAATAHALLRVQDSLAPCRQSMMDAYAMAIVAELMRLIDAGADPLVADVVRYTQEHLRRRFGLDDLARHVGLEKNYFGRRYKSLTGRTPMQDVRRVRIESAVGMMRANAHIPLKDVAFRVGMGNGQMLSRWLKRHMKLTSWEIRPRQ